MIIQPAQARRLRALSWLPVALAAAAGGLAPCGAEEKKPDSPLRLVPAVRQEGEDYRIEASGQARLPDGVVIHLQLLPIEEADKTGDAICSARAEVKQGGFAIPPWTLRRAELKVFRYRLEARVASTQDPQVKRRLPRGALSWSAAVDLPLGNWMTRCAQLAPMARRLLECATTLARHRDGLVAVARDAATGRLSSGQWKTWKERSGYARDRDAFAQAAEAAALPFPHACARAKGILGQFSSVTNMIDMKFVGMNTPESKVGLGNPEQSLTPFPQPLFETVLTADGCQQLLNILEEVVRGLNPGTEAEPRAVPAKAASASEKGLDEISARSKEFHEMPWTVEVKERQGAIVELIAICRRLAEDHKTAAADAEAQARRQDLWNDISRRIETLRQVLATKR